MKKFKDFLSLLFWGTLGGGFFVGCILGFGALLNYVGNTVIGRNSPLGKGSFVLLLVGIIYLSLQTIVWVWSKYTKTNWKENKKILKELFQNIKKPQ